MNATITFINGSTVKLFENDRIFTWSSDTNHYSIGTDKKEVMHAVLLGTVEEESGSLVPSILDAFSSAPVFFWINDDKKTIFFTYSIFSISEN